MIEKTVVKKIVADAAKKVIKEQGSKIIANEASKYHGSKVKKGHYAECKITLVGTKACICLGNDDYLELTDENVEKIIFIKEKHRIDHTYYYYEIQFRDGRISYVRMRRKYRDAMYAQCSCK